MCKSNNDTDAVTMSYTATSVNLTGEKKKSS